MTSQIWVSVLCFPLERKVHTLIWLYQICNTICIKYIGSLFEFSSFVWQKGFKSNHRKTDKEGKKINSLYCRYQSLSYYRRNISTFRLNADAYSCSCSMRIWSLQFLMTQTMCHVVNSNRILLANEMCVKRSNALSPAKVLSTAAAQPRCLT